MRLIEDKAQLQTSEQDFVRVGVDLLGCNTCGLVGRTDVSEDYTASILGLKC